MSIARSNANPMVSMAINEAPWLPHAGFMSPVHCAWIGRHMRSSSAIDAIPWSTHMPNAATMTYLHL